MTKSIEHVVQAWIEGESSARVMYGRWGEPSNNSRFKQCQTDGRLLWSYDMLIGRTNQINGRKELLNLAYPFSLSQQTTKHFDAARRVLDFDNGDVLIVPAAAHERRWIPRYASRRALWEYAHYLRFPEPGEEHFWIASDVGHNLKPAKKMSTIVNRIKSGKYNQFVCQAQKTYLSIVQLTSGVWCPKFSYVYVPEVIKAKGDNLIQHEEVVGELWLKPAGDVWHNIWSENIDEDFAYYTPPENKEDFPHDSMRREGVYSVYSGEDKDLEVM